MRQINTSGLPFSEIRESGKYYVDKTMLISDILSKDDRGIYLFTRPRRFGKSTNLSMLDAFLNMKYEGNTWFDGLEISEHHEFDRYRNAFPVLYLDLKDTKTDDVEGFRTALALTILQALKDDHPYLMHSSILTRDEVALFDMLSDGNIDPERLRISVKVITGILERYHGKKVVVLIDEYDSAVSDAFGSRSHRPMMDFLGRFMSATLKSNRSLQIAYVTGIMQIANESIFSDLNNVEVNNIFSKVSDERFGFTEAEVRGILSDYGHPDRFDEARKWYDGYRFGRAEVYNPYSIMCYVSAGFIPDPYWANSSSDKVIQWLLERIGGSGFSRVVGLVTGGTVSTGLRSTIAYRDIEKSSDSDLFSLMAMSGYLKAVPLEGGLFDVSIPNEEVRMIVDNFVELLHPVDTALFADFSDALLDGDAARMESALERILVGGSYYNLKENGYEVMLMTILWSLSRRYEVSTERDSGNGRTDVMMVPRAADDPTVVMELKTVDSERDLDRGLDEAFAQIRDRRYYAGHPGRVVLVGVSFFVKTPRVRVESFDNGPDGFGYKGARV